MSSMAFDAFVFDLGNTLVSYYTRDQFPEVLRESLSTVTEAAGISPQHIDRDRLLEDALSLSRERDDFAVWPLEERLESLFAEYIGDRTLPMDAMVNAFLKPVFACASPDPTAVEVLDELQSRGLKTGIISNTPWGSPAEPWLRELQRHDLLQRCDAVVFCMDVGRRKPHPAPFQRILEQLDVDPSRTAFVGDDPEWDIQGAEQAGLTPILLCRVPPVEISCQVIENLRDLLDRIQ